MKLSDMIRESGGPKYVFAEWLEAAMRLETERDYAHGLVSTLIEGDDGRMQTEIKLEAVDALERWRKEGWEP